MASSMPRCAARLKAIRAQKLYRPESGQTEAILRRFTRNNLKHPMYQALAEPGKANKPIFLYSYLRTEALRREIQGRREEVKMARGSMSG